MPQPPSPPTLEQAPAQPLTALLQSGADIDERDLPLGSMQPTHLLVPSYLYTHGHDAIELAEIAGYALFEFQQQGLIDKLGYNIVHRRDGARVERWAAAETEDVISRRNGKSVEIEVLILAGLFLLGEKKIMYTAHRDDTAKDVFSSVVAAIKRTPALWAEVIESGPRYANGQRSITLKSGATVYFRTRTTDSGRGQGFDRLILDEDQNLTEAHMAALMPLVSGSENAQLNYAGSAGGLMATVQAGLRRSFDRSERSFYYRGWHADADDDFDDLRLIARVNPRLGRGLSYDFIAKEFLRMTRTQFGNERMGVPNHPREEGSAWVIPTEAWDAARDAESRIAEGEKPRFVLEADPELNSGTVTVAGRRPDGAVHLEVVAHQPGVSWMVAEAQRLQDEHTGEVWLDPKGPCGFMIGDLTESGVEHKLFDAKDLADAWAWLSSAANPRRNPLDPDAEPRPGVFHRGGRLLTQALAAAEVRKILDRQTLRRTVSGDVNQGPIVGAMLAGWAVARLAKVVKVDPGFAPQRVSQRRAPERRRPPTRSRRSRTADFDPSTVDF